MNDFKKRVLDIAINQINEKQTLKLRSNSTKTGRAISGFSFKFKQKQTEISENQYLPNEIKTRLTYSPK